MLIRRLRGVRGAGRDVPAHPRGLQGGRRDRGARRRRLVLQRLVGLQVRGLRRDPVQRRPDARPGRRRDVQLRLRRARAPAEPRGGEGGQVRRRPAGRGAEVRHSTRRSSSASRSGSARSSREGRRLRHLVGSPLDASSVCLETWIDGKKYFDREADRRQRAFLAAEKSDLVAKARVAAAKGGPTAGAAPSRPAPEERGACDDDGVPAAAGRRRGPSERLPAPRGGARPEGRHGPHGRGAGDSGRGRRRRERDRSPPSADPTPRCHRARRSSSVAGRHVAPAVLRPGVPRRPRRDPRRPRDGRRLRDRRDQPGGAPRVRGELRLRGPPRDPLERRPLRGADAERFGLSRSGVGRLARRLDARRRLPEVPRRRARRVARADDRPRPRRAAVGRRRRSGGGTKR